MSVLRPSGKRSLKEENRRYNGCKSARMALKAILLHPSRK
jgi:hypothetical protein